MFSPHVRLALVAGLVLGMVSGACGDPPAADRTPARTDLYGDPLPDGALARFGTIRLRQEFWVSALAFSPDGKILASAGGDNSPGRRNRSFGRGVLPSGIIYFWDPTTGKEVRRLAGHDGIVRSLSFSPDGRRLASCANDRTVRLWDVSEGKELRRLAVPVDATTVAFSPDGKTLLGLTNVILLWDAANGEQTARLEVPQGHFISHFALSHDGKTLAATDASREATVLLWDVASRQPALQLRGHEAGVWAVAFSPDGKTLATGGQDRTVRLWETATAKQVWRSEGHPNTVQVVLFTRDGRAVLSTGSGETALLDAKTGNLIRSFGGGPGLRYALALSPDGKTVAWAVGHAVRLADTDTGKDLCPAEGHAGPVECVSFSPDGKAVASAGDVLCLWDAATSKLRLPHGPDAPVSCAAFSPDGKMLVLGSYSEQELRLWNPDAGKEVRRFTGDTGRLDFVSYLPDGKTVASMSRFRFSTFPGGGREDAEPGMRLWDCNTGKELRHVGNSRMSCIALTADGRTLAIGLKGVQLWDVPSGRELPLFTRQEPGDVLSLAFAPSGRQLAESDLDKMLRLHEVATGGEICRVTANPSCAVALALSPNDRVLASAGADGVVRVWDLASQTELRQLRGHRGLVLSLAFSSDGTRLISGGSDTTVLVWDATGILPVGAPAGHLKPEDLDALWSDLASADAAKAYRAVWALARAPEASVALLKERLPPTAAPDAERLARLIADLDAADFAVRQKATEELTRMGELAAPALRKALDSPPSVDARLRMQVLLRELQSREMSAEQLRTLRALEVLEQAGSPDARRLLESLAGGAPAAVLSLQAKASLERLARRPAAGH